MKSIRKLASCLAIVALLLAGIRLDAQNVITTTSGLVDYVDTLSTISTLAGSNTIITSSTLYIYSLRCYNTTGGAVSVSRSDLAGNNFEVTFSIPANSNYYLESQGSWAKMVGLRLWASAGSSINCIMVARTLPQ